MLTPTGFWSYTTSDETSARGRLSQLRALLAAELQQQIGRTPKVNIFQDVAAIPPGREWETQIRDAIEEASFIVPIITPGLLQSEWCCREVELFRQRERSLGVKTLVFPIHYVDVSHVVADDASQCHDPAVLAFLRTRQWIDFRHLRFRNQEGEDIAIVIEGIARSVLRALRDATAGQHGGEARQSRDQPEQPLILPQSAAVVSTPSERQPRDPPLNPPYASPSHVGAPPQTAKSFTQRIDRFLVDGGIMAWVLPLIAGLMIVFASMGVGVADIKIMKNPGGDWECGAGKQVGMWFAPNWTGVYIVLFPLFMWLISSLARHVRDMFGDAQANGAFVDQFGAVSSEAELDGLLARSLRSYDPVLVALALASALIAVVGWQAAVLTPIQDQRFADAVIDWATARAACSHGSLASLIYTALAFGWMGLALFAYFSCLFLGCVYATFLLRLASGDAAGREQRSQPRLLFRRVETTWQMRTFLRCYLWICLLGMFAAYFMRLQVAYLATPDAFSITAFWLQKEPTLGATGNAAEASNYTAGAGLAVLMATCIALIVTANQLRGAFDEARRWLVKRALGRGDELRAISGYGEEEIARIERMSFLLAVFLDVAPLAVANAGIAICTVCFAGATTFASVLLATAATVVATGLLRRRIAPAETAK